jgi:hypothetical protein
MLPKEIQDNIEPGHVEQADTKIAWRVVVKIAHNIAENDTQTQ